MKKNGLINFNTPKQFRCNNCGGELLLQNPKTQFVSCPYCGATSDVTSDAHKVINKINDPAKYPSPSFLKLGMVGNYKGQKYKIIGRIFWRNSYKELEEGAYHNSVWTFHEWLLIGEDASYLMIIEDSEGFSLSRQIYPKYPSLPEIPNIESFNSGVKQQMNEYGISQIIYNEGESTYQIINGEKIWFGQYESNGTYYSIEYRTNSNKEIKEIEFFEEHSLSRSFVTQMFGEESNIKTIIQRDTNRRKRRLINAAIVILAAIISTFLYNFFQQRNPNVTLLDKNYNINDLIKDSVINPLDSFVTLNIQEEKIIFDNAKHIYTIGLQTSLAVNDEMLINLYLLDEEKKSVYEMDADFFHITYQESWYEDGESGVETVVENEGNLSASFKSDTVGTFYLKTEIAAKLLSEENTDLRISVEEAGIENTWLFTVAFLFWIVGIIIFFASLKK